MIFPNTRSGFAAVLAFPFVATPCLAQTADDPVPNQIIVEGQRVDPLTIPIDAGSRLGLSALETPASVTTLDGDMIRARGDLSVVDAVTRAPGITSVANPGNGGTALAARGFAGQGSVLQLVDGIRLFPVAGTISFPTDPWMVERIEALTGPASVLYGQGSLGGAVNIVMRKPTTRTVIDSEIGYGSQDSFHAAAGIGGPIDERLSYRIDGSFRRSDGYVDRGRSRSLALSGTVRWAPIETLAITLRDDYGNQRPMRYFGTPLIDGVLVEANRERNYNVADGAIHYRDNRTTLTTDWTPSDTFSITNTAYRLTSKRLFRNLESYAWNPATGLIDRADNLGIIHDQTQWGDQGSVKLVTPIADGVGNTLVGGFDANLIKLLYSHDFGSDPQQDSVDPFQFDPGMFFDTQGIAPRYRTRTNEYAVFAEDRVTLGTHVSVVGGVRYEHDRIRRWTISGAGAEAFVLDKRVSNVTYRVGSVYQPVPSVSLYGQYTTGVDPIGTLTTYSTGQAQFSNATGDQIEAGAKASFLNGRGSATLAAYRIVKKRLLSQLTPTSPIEQVGQRSAKGIEAAVSFDLPAGFGIDANGTVLDAQFDEFLSGTVSFAGRTPPNIPETAANLWLRWNAMAVVQARAGLRYAGRTFSDNANRFRIPGYAVVDASVSYALTPQVAIDLRLYNAFDKNYASTTYNDQQWVLGRPRSVDVSVRAGF